MIRWCIHDVRLLDGCGADVPCADVFIKDDSIAGIRIPSGPAPADWQILPGSGCTLMPGLIDGHVQLLFDSSPRAPMAMLGKTRKQLISEALPRARATLKSGTTTIRELAGTPKAMFSLKEGLAGEKDIPRIYDCFAILTAEGGFGAEAAITVTQKTAASIIARLAEKADFFKILGDRYDDRSPDGFAPHFDDDTFAEICRAARDQGRPVTVHAKSRTTIRQCLLNKVHSIEHAVRAEADDLRAMAAQGAFLDATFWGLKCRSDNQPNFDEFDRVTAFYPRAREFGVPLTMGSDAGTVFTPHAGGVEELKLMVQAGLPPMDAIKAATSVGAQRLGDQSIGAIAMGRKADLLLIEEDPLSDISAIGHSLRWVMKDGRMV